ncbi:uncharacterized protein AMSG_03556 [Thecamonas trahens ATCC 50062]|uniref:Uncharacterized protein n=1 Tax=Thecamonas trahens ATCC 50062 TaxID=461836 RepID=A0A0L0D447_THETB|nr:hypothetical protein AMSG_03556 [Thecamonas trahens ATCC 50062]KNC47127.1 hypothetical protein AMSG_03556 [Thecamonas trahens ATCC 50062]|eukprot:XP_013759903.1 hypothetical protein AMSG_03556 [Thecamonas trahens ATCC 50062]
MAFGWSEAAEEGVEVSWSGALCVVTGKEVRKVDDTRSGAEKALTQLLSFFSLMVNGVRAVWGSYAPFFDVVYAPPGSATADVEATAMLSAVAVSFSSEDAAAEAAADYVVGREYRCWIDDAELHHVVMINDRPPSAWVRSLGCFRAFFVVVLPVYACLELAVYMAAPVHDLRHDTAAKVT